MTLGPTPAPDRGDVLAPPADRGSRHTRRSPHERLLNPRSIAVVGASADTRKVGGRIISFLRKFGYRGPIIPINPKYSDIQGEACAPSVDAMPLGVDLVIICVKPEDAAAAFRAACERAVGAAIISSSGFAEVGTAGAALQSELAELARAHEVLLVGPNSLGLLSLVNGLCASFASTLATLPAFEAGRVPLVTQSGGFGMNVYVEALAQGARFSHLITTGNEAGATVAGFIEYFAADPTTPAIIGQLEGAREPDALIATVTRATAAGKRVALLATSSSEIADPVVAAHTALPPLGVDLLDTLFTECGAIRLATLDEMIDFATLAEFRGRAPLAVASVSGGTAAYIADWCARLDVPLANLAAETLASLERIIPAFGRVGNPTDVTAQIVQDVGLLREVLEALAADKGVGAILLFLGGMEDQAEAIRDTLQAADLRGRPMAVCWAGVREGARQTLAGTAPVLRDPLRFLRAFALWNRASR